MVVNADGVSVVVVIVVVIAVTVVASQLSVNGTTYVAPIGKCVGFFADQLV